jgi:hypothetical protein
MHASSTITNQVQPVATRHLEVLHLIPRMSGGGAEVTLCRVFLQSKGHGVRHMLASTLADGKFADAGL